MTRYMLVIECTDRGTHPPAILGDLTGHTSLLRANVGASYGDANRRRVDASLWLDDVRRPDYRVQARCPRCKRHEQWRGEGMVRVMEKLEVAGISRLDISLRAAIGC